MTLIAIGSLKGSPGATTLALGLASRWPTGYRPVVVECDPAGGDLVARFRLALEPGLVSLAAAARRTESSDLLWQHTQQLPGELRVVAGPPGADQAHAALTQLMGASVEQSALGRAAAPAGAVIVADCGRIDPHSPVLPLVRGADDLLLLMRARDDALAHAASKVDVLSQWSRRPSFVLVGDGYRSQEVSRELGFDVLAHLPEDPRGAAVLRGVGRRRSALVRSELGKALAVLAVRLVDKAAAEPRSEAAASEAGVA
ncbi:hypothetical protein GCM10022403_083400 [Streptomyces coacervatus]|uniref:ParA family protein n=1 Tax=Streptomyces coacervatus TaxID=647381 RepID=A0ABP7J9F6_9ACTN|nr:hypothetical protein [Streptomyces coacervatus]MDF2270304.1 hypothetical protein [Streptomyces coacervatus]